MAHQPGMQKSAPSAKAQATGLVAVRIAIGIFVLFSGIGKLRWLMDSTALSTQLADWYAHAGLMSRWYLERIMPGAPVFARLVPLGEILGGLALIAGFWTRLVAGVLLLMVLNFQLAGSVWFHYAYLTDPTGLPMLASLFALTIGGGRLPMSIRR
jgi:uncharacterized membrane protein YphA (DoxX/SURF4 family)